MHHLCALRSAHAIALNLATGHVGRDHSVINSCSLHALEQTCVAPYECRCITCVAEALHLAATSVIKLLWALLAQALTQSVAPEDLRGC